MDELIHFIKTSKGLKVALGIIAAILIIVFSYKLIQNNKLKALEREIIQICEEVAVENGLENVKVTLTHTKYADWWEGDQYHYHSVIYASNLEDLITYDAGGKKIYVSMQHKLESIFNGIERRVDEKANSSGVNYDSFMMWANEFRSDENEYTVYDDSLYENGTEVYEYRHSGDWSDFGDFYDKYFG